MAGMILVTGGAGFIGSNFIVDWLGGAGADEPVLNIDHLGYAGNPDNLAPVRADPRHRFEKIDICERDRVLALMSALRPRAVVHFAAESHVDRSIAGPDAFIRSNIDGTFALLEAARIHWSGLDTAGRNAFRFLHVSTDEVYGALAADDAPSSEASPYRPRNPYSASKAASDHLVRAWHHTYGLPTLITHCTNNHGPRQLPEKLIPKTITRALAGEPIPVYGDGLQVRDWLSVGDHCSALRRILDAGRPGETYCISGGNQKTNLEVVETLCRLLDEARPDPAGPYARLVTRVADRPGHDRRYALDSGKLAAELGWRPAETFERGIARTLRWYLDHPDWIERARARTGSAR